MRKRHQYAPITVALDGPIWVEYTLVNVGESPAIVEKIACEIVFKPQAGYPIHAKPIDPQDAWPPAKPIILKAGESQVLWFSGTGSQTWDASYRREYTDLTTGVFFSGLVIYSDESPRKTLRHTGWYRRYDIHRQSFGRLDWGVENEYEYTD